MRTCPASFVQRRFWTLQQRNPAEAFFNVPFVFRLSGPLDTVALRDSFQAIVNRHESLRTTLQEIDSELMQVIAPAGSDLLVVSNVASPGSAALQENLERPFDLASEPGLRVLLLQTGDDEFILQLCFHNTLFDQSSLLVLLRELSQHYSDLVSGQPTALPPPAQYSEYVAWQESLLSSGMQERRSYWQEWFNRGEIPKLPWRTRESTPSYQAHITWQHYSPELTQQLKAISRRNGITIYITLVAAYAMVLRQYTGVTDLTIGTTYSNRDQWQFESLIGATINVPALRLDTAGSSSLTALLLRVKVAVAEALTYQDVPYEQIVPNHEPLFRVVFSFFPETAQGRLHLPGIRVTFLQEFVNQLSRPDLYLVLWENQTDSGPALAGYWLHKQAVFTAEEAARMNQDFQALLAAIAT